MEASFRSTRDLDDDEDMESFLKTIKLHDRFVDDYFKEDEEIFSDEELNADSENLSGLQKGRCSKRENDYHRILSSGAKVEAISALDTMRSSCQKSGRAFNLLDLKSNESGSGDNALLGDSFCCVPSFGDPCCPPFGDPCRPPFGDPCRPPFGDPLSEDDILTSALSLLDDEQCKKFREVGLFDGFVVKGRISTDAETLLVASDTCFTDQSLDLKETMQQKTPEKPDYNSCNVLTSIQKSEDDKEIVISSPDLSGDEISSQNPEATQEQNISKENTKCSDLDNDALARDRIHVNNDALARDRIHVNNDAHAHDRVHVGGDRRIGVAVFKGSNPGPKKKTRGKKGNTNSSPSNTATAMKSKASPARKTDLASGPQLEKLDLPSEEKDEVKTNDGICKTTDCSDSTFLSSVVLVHEVPQSDFGLTEDEGICEEFTIVHSKRKPRTQKEAHHTDDSPSELLRDKHGTHSRFSPALALNAAPTYPTPKTFRINDGKSSRQSSCSSTNESSNPVSRASARDESREIRGLFHRPPNPSHPTPGKTPAPNSYASVLSQNLPRLSVNASAVVAEFSVKEDFDANNLEPGLLSPPQSETDTGFSSASSSSPDETQTSVSAQHGMEMNLAQLSSLSFSSEKEKPNVYEGQSSTSRKAAVQENASSANPDPSPNATPHASIEHCKLEDSSYERHVACSNRLHVAQHRKGAVFFDTRNPGVPDSTASSDIVFGYDSGDECTDVGTESGNFPLPHENLIDLSDVTFFAGSTDATDPADGAGNPVGVFSPKTSTGFARDGESDGDKENFEPSTEMSLKNGNFQIASAKSGDVEKSVGDVINACDLPREHLEEVRVTERNDQSKDLCFKNSVFRSGDNDAKIFSSVSRFDLRAAQMFLRKAFERILRQESEFGSKVLRF